MAAPQITVFAQGVGAVNADYLNGVCQSCDVPSQLRAVTGISGNQVFMRGYVTPNDGGQGFFYWSSISVAVDDNGATTIKPYAVGLGSPGAWVRIGGASGVGGGSGLPYAADTGVLNALAVTLSPIPSSYATGLSFITIPKFTNTGAATINVNGLGNKAILFNGLPVQAGLLAVNLPYILVYDGTAFEIMNSPGGGGWITDAMLAPMPANTIIGNNTGSTATPTNIPISSLIATASTGQYGFFSTTTLPSGWQLCDGSTVLRSSPLGLLYAPFGYPYGIGDGSTTCNVPNFLGVFPRGLNTTGSGYDPNRVLGSVQLDQLQTHNHASGVVSTTGSPPAYAYGTTSNGIPGTSGNTMHTDNNTAQQQGYTSGGSPATGTGTGAPTGTFGTETRPVNLGMVIAVHL